MALINIEYGSVASSKVLNDNFNYLEDKIEDYSKNIASDKASLTSLINSQISTTFTQLNAKITESIQALYPIDSIYIGTTNECPIASLFGTWEKVAEGLCLQGATDSQVAGETVEAGLPNITGFTAGFPYSASNMFARDGSGKAGPSGAFYSTGWARTGSSDGREGASVAFDASRSNSIYKDDCDTVQPPAYLVNVWRRIA
jgi:hypothetical protein